MTFESFDTPDEAPPTARINRLAKLQILVGLLDSAIDHEQHRDTPFLAPEWLVKHYPHVDPVDLDDVLDAARHALTRIVAR